MRRLARLAEIDDAARRTWPAGQVLSLPGDPDVARREYEKYLNQLFSRHNITNRPQYHPARRST